MKKVLLITAFVFSLPQFVDAKTIGIAQPIGTPQTDLQALKLHLIEKYQGKINGVQTLSRLTPYYEDVLYMFPLDQYINAAANELTETGEIDLNKVEMGIEQELYSNLMKIFKHSIGTAEKSAKHEVSKDLFAISPWNKEVIWNQDQTRVLMLTWIPAAYRKTYDDALNNNQELDITWDAWVTAVPEVKNFAIKYVASHKDGFNLTDRIEQFLGLLPSKPPYSTTQNKLFVEMWVKPEDLFRPCLDAEITDGECTIDPHESDLKDLPLAFRDMSKFIPMTAEHKAWFEKEKKGKYQGDWAMPWTRFGYTYDWGSEIKFYGKKAAKGATEYLIKKPSKVIIHSVIPTDDYPNIPTPKSGYIYTE